MRNNLILQISQECMEMKGEEINIRTAGGSSKNAVEGNKTNKKTSAHTHTHSGDAAIQINTRVIHTPIDESTPSSLGISTSYNTSIMGCFMQ